MVAARARAARPASGRPERRTAKKKATKKKTAKQKPTKTKAPKKRTAKKKASKKKLTKKKAASNKRVEPPVVGRLELLPLADDNFWWTKFEAFCTDLVAALPEIDPSTVRQYGKAGSAQKGIDILASTKSGDLWVFQCKRHKSFTEAQTRKAIETCEYQADRYFILTACEVGVGPDDVCSAQDGWTFWDGRVISRQVRMLRLEVARRLVEHHFGPDWAKSYLGVGPAVDLLTVQEYFSGLTDPSRPFHHAAQLHGRESELATLTRWLAIGRTKLLVLSGVGGSGKSRLILEAARVETQAEVYFLSDTCTVDKATLGEISLEPTVLVVDDAHRKTEVVGRLVEFARTSRPSLRLLLVVRPHGVDAVRTVAMQNSIAANDIEPMDLIALDKEATEAVVKDLLPGASAHWVEDIAKLSRDTPVVAVLSCWLLKSKGRTPKELADDEDIRSYVLSRYSDEVLGNIGGPLPKAAAVDLMGTLALIQPMRTDDPLVIGALAKHVSVKPHHVRRQLDALEAAGVLKRAGRFVRIVPDVLADHILISTCTDGKGHSVGFAEDVYEAFGQHFLPNLTRNLAELDWKMGRSSGQDTELLDALWGKLREQAVTERSHSVFELVAGVACYQPTRVIQLAEELVASTGRDEITAPESSHLRNSLAALIAPVGYTFDYLPRVCELLWELGRDDARETGQHPNHPIRKLAELAAYKRRKPLQFNEAVLDAAEGWFEAEKDVRRAHFFLDIIDPLFAHFGEEYHSEGNKMVINRFLVSGSRTLSIRERGIALVGRCIREGGLPLAMRATSSLSKVVRPLLAPFGGKVPEREEKNWEPLVQTAVGEIGSLLTLSLHTLIRLRLRSVLEDIRKWYPDAESGRRANDLLADMDEDFETRFYQALLSTWWDYDDPEYARDTFDAFAGGVAAEFLEHYPDPASGANRLEVALGEVQHYPRSGHAGFFLHALGKRNPDYGRRLLIEAVGSGANGLLSYGQSLLSPMRTHDEGAFWDVVELARSTPSQALLRAAAHGLAWGSWDDGMNPQEEELIKEFLSGEDRDLKLMAISAVGRLGDKHPELAVELLGLVRIGGDVKVAEEVCQQWGKHRIPWQMLGDDIARHIIDGLREVDDLDDYHVQEFLGRLTDTRAAMVVDLFLERFDRSLLKRYEERDDYRPIPYRGLESRHTSFKADEEFDRLLRKIKARMDGSWQTGFWLPKLFLSLARCHSERAVAVLREGLAGSEQDLLASIDLMQDLGPRFVFGNVGFICDLIDAAASFDGDTLKKASSSLRILAESGERSGTPGEPFPQDVLLRDSAKAAAQRFNAGTPQHKYFTSLVAVAESNIRDSLRRDEEVEAGM